MKPRKNGNSQEKFRIKKKWKKNFLKKKSKKICLEKKSFVPLRNYFLEIYRKLNL